MAHKISNCDGCGFKHYSHEPHIGATYVEPTYSDPWADPNVNFESKYATRG